MLCWALVPLRMPGTARRGLDADMVGALEFLKSHFVLYTDCACEDGFIACGVWPGGAFCLQGVGCQEIGLGEQRT
eukprot:2067648-Amphidinium_carterae.2